MYFFVFLLCLHLIVLKRVSAGTNSTNVKEKDWKQDEKPKLENVEMLINVVPQSFNPADVQAEHRGLL